MTTELHDAELQTEDYLRRHSETSRNQLGVWRWKGINKHRERILAAVVGKRCIDFGGFDGPLGNGSVIVDPKCALPQKHPVANRVIREECYPDLRSLPSHWWDTFFTSHTLEHVPDLGELLKNVYHHILRPGGQMIAHVPAYTCTRWRPDNYENAEQEPHLRTFGLVDDEVASEIVPHIMPLEVIPRNDMHWADWHGFRVDLAEHCGDDSIIVFATKPYPVPA